MNRKPAIKKSRYDGKWVLTFRTNDSLSSFRFETFEQARRTCINMLAHAKKRQVKT